MAVGPLDPSGFNTKTPKSATISGAIVMARVWPSVWRTAPDFQYALDTDLMLSAEIVSTDPQTVVYKINPRATWSDGVPISAEDFIYNWQMSRPGATDVDGAPIQAVGVAGSRDPIASVVGSEDGKTVTVVFTSPYRPWKALFGFLVPAHVGKRIGWNTGFDNFDPAVVISGGPFRIAHYNPGRDLTLVRNERYWAEPAGLDEIVIRFVPGGDFVSAFLNGEADLVHAFASDQDTLERIRGAGQAVHSVLSGPSQEYVGFNFRNELLAIPEVRKAFALALDRSLIVDRAVGRANAAVVNNHLFAHSQPEYIDTSAGRYDRQNVAGAKRLLEGAGFSLDSDGIYAKDGKRLSFRIRTDSTNATRQVEEQLVQSQVRQAGIELRSDDAPLNLLLPQLRRGDFDVEVLQYPKSPSGSAPTFRTGNKWAYSNPRLDDLISHAGSELDDDKWRDILQQIDEQLWEDMPIVPLYQVPRLLVVRNTYVNVEENPASALGPFWNAERWGRKGGG